MSITNLTPPVISGNPVQGQVLTTTTGTWTSTNPLIFTYQWLRCDSGGGSCIPISGATGSQYTLTSADLGDTIRSEVTATETSPRTTYYVRTTGNDSTGNGLVGNPYKTIAKALSVAPAGSAIDIGTGTFVETISLTIQDGMEIFGTGSATTIIRASSSTVNPLMSVQNGSGQSIHDLTLDGQSRTTSAFGLYIHNTTDATVNLIKSQGFKNTANMQGAALDEAGNTNLTISNSTFLNSGGQVPSTPFYNGCVGLGASTGTTFDTNTVTTDASYCIKASGSGTITDLVISHCTFSTALTGNFGISVELFTMTFVNCRAHHNLFDGIVSLTGPGSNPDIGNPKTNGGNYHFRLDHNRWDIPSGTQGDRYCIEASSRSLEIDHNYVNHGGLYPFSYFESSQISSHWIHHNIIDQTSNPIAFSHFANGIIGSIWEKNTVVLRHAFTIGVFNGLTNSTDQISTSIFYGTVNVGNNLNPGGATVSGNGFYNITAVGSGTIGGDPGLSLASFPAGYTPTNGAYSSVGAFADGSFSDVGP